jgi:16S rRNA (uracil1498-N3)-methyltransferase
VLLIVGPEGGFERDEAEALRAAGAVSVSLGSLVFRTETAGLAAAIMILYHTGDLGRAPTRRQPGWPERR